LTVILNCSQLDTDSMHSVSRGVETALMQSRYTPRKKSFQNLRSLWIKAQDAFSVSWNKDLEIFRLSQQRHRPEIHRFEIHPFTYCPREGLLGLVADVSVKLGCLPHSRIARWYLCWIVFSLNEMIATQNVFKDPGTNVMTAITARLIFHGAEIFFFRREIETTTEMKSKRGLSKL